MLTRETRLTSHSEVVSAMVGSSIVVKASTKGTPAKATLNKSGLILRTEPISNPPAFLPSMHSFSFGQNLCSIQYSAQAIISVKVFFFFKYFRFSYHCLPIPPPPRI
jgi:hypothetical protein